MSKTRRALAAALAACIFGPVPAHAAGFAIFEQGARGMGFAGAFTAQANDPSAIFHNAAGIAFLKGKQFYFGGTLIHPSTTFTGADPFPGASVTEKGDTGLVVPPENPHALATAIRALAAEPTAARADRRRKARARIVEQFAMAHAIQRYGELYASLGAPRD